MKTHAQTEQVEFVEPRIRSRAKLPRHREFVALVAMIIVVSAAVGLSSCTGYTNAAGTTSGTLAGIAISPASLSFTTTVGQTDIQTVTITNNGTSSLHLKSATVSGAGFALSGLSLPTAVSVGQSISFSVQFTPASTTTVSGSIAFTDDAPASPQILSLTGDATTAALSLGASPTSLDFGNVQVGSNNSLTTAVTNIGNSDVTISSVTVTGTGYSASGVTSGVILSPSQTVTLTITFAPTALGSASGSVSIASSATNSPTTISLSGESHTVMLSWTASTSSGVTGYYIYRATSSGSYTKLNSSSPVSTTQYTDATVQAATTYSYEVTAVDSSGVESSYSSPTTAIVP